MNAKVTHYMPTQPDSIPEQMSQIEDVITKRPDAVVFIPVDFKAMAPASAEDERREDPRGQRHRPRREGGIVTFVGPDDYSVGLATGRYLFKKIGGRQRHHHRRRRGVQTSSDRLRGFKKRSRNFPT